MRTKKYSQMIPIKRVDQRQRNYATEADSVPMCEVNKQQRTLKFLDEKVFIKACRVLYEHQEMEFFEETEKKY